MQTCAVVLTDTQSYSWPRQGVRPGPKKPDALTLQFYSVLPAGSLGCCTLISQRSLGKWGYVHSCSPLRNEGVPKDSSADLWLQNQQGIGS